MPRRRALAGAAVTNDAKNDSANDAQTKPSAATTRRKNLGAISDEVDALSHVGAAGVLCNGAMRKVRDNAERQFYVDGHLSYPHPAIHCGIGVNARFLI
jgi:hypothetical protein